MNSTPRRGKAVGMPRGFQTPGSKTVDRSDHIWALIEGKRGTRFKCILCGCVTMNPPPYPTPKEWSTTEYEDLTQEERELRPYIHQASDH